MSALDAIAKAIKTRHENSTDADVAAQAITILEGAGYVILSPDEVRGMERALSRAEEGAGTPPAREAVKLRPSDWHALAAAIRSLKGGRDAR